MSTIIDVRVLDGYRIELTFSDGVRGIVDLANRISAAAAVSPLENPEIFRQAAVDPELGTIVWPNGADFCPECFMAR